MKNPYWVEEFIGALLEIHDFSLLFRIEWRKICWKSFFLSVSYGENNFSRYTLEALVGWRMIFSPLKKAQTTENKFLMSEAWANPMLCIEFFRGKISWFWKLTFRRKLIIMHGHEEYFQGSSNFSVHSFPPISLSLPFLQYELLPQLTFTSPSPYSHFCNKSFFLNSHLHISISFHFGFRCIIERRVGPKMSKRVKEITNHSFLGQSLDGEVFFFFFWFMCIGTFRACLASFSCCS